MLFRSRILNKSVYSSIKSYSFNCDFITVNQGDIYSSVKNRNYPLKLHETETFKQKFADAKYSGAFNFNNSLSVSRGLLKRFELPELDKFIKLVNMIHFADTYIKPPMKKNKELFEEIKQILDNDFGGYNRLLFKHNILNPSI